MSFSARADVVEVPRGWIVMMGLFRGRVCVLRA